jgi:hypothetical protein
MPLPTELTTPPVTKIYFGILNIITPEKSVCVPGNYAGNQI